MSRTSLKNVHSQPGVQVLGVEPKQVEQKSLIRALANGDTLLCCQMLNVILSQTGSLGKPNLEDR